MRFNPSGIRGFAPFEYRNHKRLLRGQQAKGDNWLRPSTHKRSGKQRRADDLSASRENAFFKHCRILKITEFVFIAREEARKNRHYQGKLMCCIVVIILILILLLL